MHDNGGIKYSHLYHGIDQLAYPTPEKQRELGVLDEGCMHLLFRLAVRAEQDGGNIKVTQEVLAQKCHCTTRQIRTRLKILLAYGYLQKATDETGKVRKTARTTIYNLFLPGVHDVLVQRTLSLDDDIGNDPLEGLDLPEPEQPSPKLHKIELVPLPELGPFAGMEEIEIEGKMQNMTNEEYKEFEKHFYEIVDRIVEGISLGVSSEKFTELAQSWYVDLNRCIVEGVEKKRKSLNIMKALV